MHATQPEEKDSHKHQNKLSVQELIQLAEQAYDQFSPGIAAKYYEDAIIQQPTNALLHHKLAVMYVEHGEPQLAHKSFLKSIELSPNENESNYLYIGQQCYGDAAKAAFENGINLMQKKISALENSNDAKKAKQINSFNSEISSAYVSIAELFMTDLCEDLNAENECEKYLNLSLQFDKNNVESYATFAQFKCCQQNNADAIKYFNISLQKLWTNDEDDSNDDNKTEIDDKLDIFGSEALSMDSFLKIVKLGIELQQYEASLLVLKALINANDGIGEFWALGALCYYKLNKTKHAAIWLNNAESIALMESGSCLNLELNETLQVIRKEINTNDLPDISKLNLDETFDEKDVDEKDNEDEDEIDRFLEDYDYEDDEDDDEDIDIDIDRNEMIDID